MDFTEETKPVAVSVNTKTQELKANKTYFYEMPSGKIEPVEEREAWELHKKKYKQIGVSDGKTFMTALAESRQLFKEQGLEAAQERLRRGVEEELEIARGHFETPPNFDMFGNGVREMRTKMRI